MVSELAWLTTSPPAAARAFFETCYPDMKHADENVAVAEAMGYEVLGTHTLPRRAWVDGYYDVLAPRARSLADHPDPTVRGFASETLREIDAFETSGDSYGYIFYMLQRP